MQIFRLPGKQGYCLRLKLGIVVQAVEYAGNKHRKRRRRAKPRTGVQFAADNGVKAAEARVKVEHRGGNAAHECL